MPEHRGRQVIDSVASYVHKRPGGTFSLDDVMEELGEGFNRDTVRKALSTDLLRKGFNIETVVRGSIYRFHGMNRVESRSSVLFEKIGQTKEGDPILQCEDGAIYIAKEVKY